LLIFIEMNEKYTNSWLRLSGNFLHAERLNKDFQAVCYNNNLEPGNSLLEDSKTNHSLLIYVDEEGDFSEIGISKEGLIVDFSIYFSKGDLVKEQLIESKHLPGVPTVELIHQSVLIKKSVIFSKPDSYEVRFPFYRASGQVWYQLSRNILIGFDMAGLLSVIRLINVKSVKEDRA